MYFSDRVTLVSRKEPTQDDIGNTKFTEAEAEVWADIASPTRAEVTAAGVNGLKPSCVVTVHATDYAGQSVVKVHGRPLVVYRTYRPNLEDVELYVREDRGENRGD